MKTIKNEFFESKSEIKNLTENENNNFNAKKLLDEATLELKKLRNEYELLQKQKQVKTFFLKRFNSKNF